MMANPPWTNEERNHHNAYSGNLTTLLERSRMIHNTGIAVTWTSEEDEFLVQGLASYSSDSCLSRYIKIALGLSKNVRDVAIRCKWIYENENAKRRKKDTMDWEEPELTIRFKHRESLFWEIIDMVVASQVFVPSQHEITNELLKQNKQWFHQISANFTPLSLMYNVELFNKIRKNINTIVDNLNEDVSETMKPMPPLPEKLNDELFYAICFPESNLPKLT